MGLQLKPSMFALTRTPPRRLPEKEDIPITLKLPRSDRSSIDDLKAMYYEARMMMKPNDTGRDVANWFWGETALGDLVREVKAKMESSEDPVMKGAGYGIAR